MEPVRKSHARARRAERVIAVLGALSFALPLSLFAFPPEPAKPAPAAKAAEKKTDDKKPAVAKPAEKKTPEKKPAKPPKPVPPKKEEPPLKEPRPFGIDKWEPVKTSTVIGSPDDPPPYRVRRVYEKLPVNNPIFVITEPGTRRLMILDQPKGDGVRWSRTTETPEDGQLEKLHEFDGTAYTICFHPKFEENGYLYVGWSTPLKTKPKHVRISRFTMSKGAPRALDLASETTIIDWLSDGHNGAAVCFGLDGMMYVTSGDGTSDSDENIAGQGTDHLLSKVLRIDVDHPDPGKTYSVPKDNPFYGKPGWAPETWALGMRNPWRMCTDPLTGNIWVGNNGQDLYEQVYLVRKGDNYGWSVYEGSQPFYLTRKLAPGAPHTPPMFEHSHMDSRSLTGGVVYLGKEFPELYGAYFYGDHSTGKIWAGMHDGKKLLWHKEASDTTLAISGFGLDPDGELLVIDYRAAPGGGFYRLEKTTAKRNENFPRKLSQSGLFRDVAKHQLVENAIPYSVNAPLWSDGTYKERFLVLTPHESGDPAKLPQISLGGRGWGFPDKTVAVKSFAYETVAGDPKSRKWIETRFITRQEGEWIGYSYRWNDEQTDATLVEAKGDDAIFEVKGEGAEPLKWHYPSRAECMTCHARAANFVLGFNNPQMNKDHDYGGVVDNQLRTLAHLGLCKPSFSADVQAKLKEIIKAEESIGDDAALTERMKAINNEQRRYTKPGEGPLYDYVGRILPRLVDPYSEKETLEARARSYLHANCAICHVQSGGGNSQVEFAQNFTLDKMNVFDVDPLHHKFGIKDAKIIARGDPDRSVLVRRLEMRGPGQMPQLATNKVDKAAVAMFRAWIKGMGPDYGAPPPPAAVVEPAKPAAAKPADAKTADPATKGDPAAPPAKESPKK